MKTGILCISVLHWRVSQIELVLSACGYLLKWQWVPGLYRSADSIYKDAGYWLYPHKHVLHTGSEYI
jgi:hypothetical protein